jgi:ketosteroid isomerase-like protein
MADDRARAEIAALFERWLSSFDSEDHSFFEYVLDPNWTYTDIFGTVRSKGDYIDYLREDVPPTLSGRLVELHARQLGDVALVTGLYTIEGTLVDGTDLSSSSRFTAVWQRGGAEGWTALAHQATSVRSAA